MEIEVKLRLPNQTTHKTLTTLLTPHHTKTHHQHNHFFDTTTTHHLTTHHTVLRLRQYTHPPPSTKPTSILSLKSKPTLINGVSRVQEDEEELDPDEAQKILSDPTRLKTLLGSSRIMTRVKNEFLGGEGDFEFGYLGGFGNVRNVYEWEGLVLEVDETSYEFGTLYEVECESVEPERAKGLIEGFLKENGVEYEYSVMSKFAIFRAGKLP